LRLQVAVDNPLACAASSARQILQNNASRRLWRQLSFSRRTTRQVLTFKVLHCDEFEAVGLPQIENANDVAMRNLASQDQFLLEALEDFRLVVSSGRMIFSATRRSSSVSRAL